MSEERVDLTDLLFQVANVGTSAGTSEEHPDVERALVETLIAELTDGNAGVLEIAATPSGSRGGSGTAPWSLRPVYGYMGHQKRLMIMEGKSIEGIPSADLARPEELVELDLDFLERLPPDPRNDVEGDAVGDASAHRMPGGAVRALALFARMEAVSKYPTYAKSGDIVGIVPMSAMPGLFSSSVGDSSLLLDLEAFMGLRTDPRNKGIDPSIALFEQSTQGALRAHLELARCTRGCCRFDADDSNCKARSTLYVVSLPRLSAGKHAGNRQAAPAVTVDDVDDVRMRTCGLDGAQYRSWNKNMQSKYAGTVRVALPPEAPLPARLVDLAALALREGLGTPLVCGCVAVAGLFVRCGEGIGEGGGGGGAARASPTPVPPPTHPPIHPPSTPPATTAAPSSSISSASATVSD